MRAIIWLPIASGVLLLAFGRDDRADAVRWAALVASLVSFVVTIPLVTGFDAGTASMQFVEKHAWIARFNVWYTLGVDGLSVWFILLTSFTTPIVVISAVQDAINRIQSASIHACIAKPFDLDDLVRTVGQYAHRNGVADIR